MNINLTFNLLNKISTIYQVLRHFITKKYIVFLNRNIFLPVNLITNILHIQIKIVHNLKHAIQTN